VKKCDKTYTTVFGINNILVLTYMSEIDFYNLHSQKISLFAAATQKYATVFFLYKSHSLVIKVKGKVLPYSLPSVGPGADPGVQAVSPQVTFKLSLAVGCHYFPPDLWSVSQPKNVTVLRPVPSYTAW